MNDKNILEMRGITKAFEGVKALDHVDLSIRAGEIHALIGENGAGKSTLMKILLGLYKYDEGRIEYMGKRVRFKSPADALSNGISMIHQEITLVQDMDVAENIWMGRERQFYDAMGLNWGKRYKATEDLLKSLDIGVNVRSKIKDLSVASTQLVELARAVSYNSNIIIMDEPTSSLADKEIALLFRIINQLSARGCAVIFISHKLEEILNTCERVTVLRDGHNIATEDCASITKEHLIKLIVGRELGDMYTKTSHAGGEVVLEVRRLNSPGLFKDVNFKLYKGEVLGFSGLVGAGRTEIMNAVFGLDPYSTGEVYLHGNKINNRHSWYTIKSGIGLVTEDRLRTGIIQSMSVMNNGTLTSIDRFKTKFKLLSKKKEKSLFTETVKGLSVRYSSTSELIENLSGGNQQKIMIVRWLICNVDVLILDEPTRGIDIGAKSEIYKLIDQLTEKGISVILVSSELPELLAMSDRIIVVHNGDLVFTCGQEEATQELLTSHAFGISEESSRGEAI